MVKNNLAQSIGETDLSTKRTIYPSARRGCGSEEDPKDEHEQHAIKLIKLLGKENDFAEDLAKSLDSLDATFNRLLNTELSPLKALKEVEYITNHASKLGATELMRNAYRMLISIQNNKEGEFPALLKESQELFSQLKTRLQSVSDLSEPA
jgi:hypothetical protein